MEVAVVVTFWGSSVLAGDFLFLFPALRVTWVNLSSLLGWPPVSGFVFFTLSISAAIVLVVVVVSFLSLVVAVVVVFAVVVAETVFEGRSVQNALAVCMTSTGVSCSQKPPSSLCHGMLLRVGWRGTLPHPKSL